MKQIVLGRLLCIDDYNKTMNFVGISDQLAKYYLFDGGHWRCRKRTMPIIFAFFKRAGDQGYLIYKTLVALALARFTSQRRHRGDSPSARTRTSPGAPKVLSHKKFCEKIAEGLLIMAYNDLFGKDVPLGTDVIPLLPSLRARKLIDPSPDGMTTGGSSGTAVSVPRHAPLGKRSISDALASTVDDTAPVLGNGHKMIAVEDAYARLGKAPKKKNPYCGYQFCMQAAGNQRVVCGEGSSRTQAGRSKAGFWCPGPGCARAYHPVCYMLRHRLQTERE